MTEPRAHPGLELSPGPGALTAAGLGSLALAALAGWSDLLMVVGGHVVPGWGASAVVLGLALVLWRIFLRAARREAALRLAGTPAGWVRPVSHVLIVVAVSGIAWGALADLTWTARYHVLRPTGPGGCTVVVRESTFLQASGGQAYAVGRSGLALGEAGSWTVDDGYRPVERGTYELTWRRDGGRLDIEGTQTDPVISGGGADIDCWW